MAASHAASAFGSEPPPLVAPPLVAPPLVPPLVPPAVLVGCGLPASTAAVVVADAADEAAVPEEAGSATTTCVVPPSNPMVTSLPSSFLGRSKITAATAAIAPRTATIPMIGPALPFLAGVGAAGTAWPPPVGTPPPRGIGGKGASTTVWDAATGAPPGKIGSPTCVWPRPPTGPVAYPPPPVGWAGS